MAKKKYSLVGIDGNCYAILCYVCKAMKECGHSKEEIEAYQKRAKSSDYNNLLIESISQIEELNNEC